MLRRPAVLLKGRNWPWFPLYSCSFVLLGIMAVHFHEERIYGSDASSYLFGVVNNEWFYTERGRIIIYLSQWLPLLAVWLGLSMKAVLIAHSLGHVLFFYLIFLVGHFHYRKPHVGGLMLIIQTLTVTEAYFAWPYGEVYYGVGLCMLLLMMTGDGRPLGLWSAAMTVTLCAFLITGHPLVFPCLVSGLAMLLAYRGLTARLKLVTAGLLLTGVLRFMLFPTYDGQLAGQFIGAGLTSLPPTDEVVGLLQTHAVLWAALATTLIHLSIRRRWTAVILAIGSVMLISLVISRFAPLDGATQQYYQAYSGVFVVTMHLGVFHGNLSARSHQFISIGLVTMALWSAWGVHRFSGQVTAHIQRLKTLAGELQEFDGNRFIIHGYNMCGDSTLVWQSSEPFHEVLLISATMEKPVLLRVFERGMEYLEWEEQGVIPIEGPSDPRTKRKWYPDSQENRLCVAEWLHHIEPVFNRRYFNPDREPGYRFINTAAACDAERHGNVTLELMTKSLPDGVLLNVLLRNNGQTLHSSAGNGLSLSVIGCEGADTLRRPLTKDVKVSSTEVIHIPDWWWNDDLQVVLTERGNPLARQYLH